MPIENKIDIYITEKRKRKRFDVKKTYLIIPACAAISATSMHAAATFSNEISKKPVKIKHNIPVRQTIKEQNIMRNIPLANGNEY